jgi:hypothetical protein
VASFSLSAVEASSRQKGSMRKKKKNIKAPLRFEVVSLFPGCFEKKKRKKDFHSKSLF